MSGLALVGYGLLVLTGLTVHESPWLAMASLASGLVLLWRRLPQVSLHRRLLVIVLGGVTAFGTLLYNAVRSSDLSWPEWVLVGYGLVLMAASFFLEKRLGRATVGSVVAWSFPLVLAPMAVFATNAVFSSGAAGSAADPVVHALVVAPTAGLMNLLGTPVHLVGNNMVLETPRGGLTLGIGLVCAGLYPMALFAGILGLHAWQSQMRAARFAVHLAVGLVVLWGLNLVRLLILADVGIRYGGATLQTVHDHLGWVLFSLFMVGYWAVVALGRAAASPKRTPQRG